MNQISRNQCRRGSKPVKTPQGVIDVRIPCREYSCPICFSQLRSEVKLTLSFNVPKFSLYYAGVLTANPLVPETVFDDADNLQLAHRRLNYAFFKKSESPSALDNLTNPVFGYFDQKSLNLFMKDNKEFNRWFKTNYQILINTKLFLKPSCNAQARFNVVLLETFWFSFRQKATQYWSSNSSQKNTFFKENRLVFETNRNSFAVKFLSSKMKKVKKLITEVVAEIKIIRDDENGFQFTRVLELQHVTKNVHFHYLANSFILGLVEKVCADGDLRNKNVQKLPTFDPLDTDRAVNYLIKYLNKDMAVELAALRKEEKIHAAISDEHSAHRYSQIIYSRALNRDGDVRGLNSIGKIACRLQEEDNSCESVDLPVVDEHNQPVLVDGELKTISYIPSVSPFTGKIYKNEFELAVDVKNNFKKFNSCYRMERLENLFARKSYFERNVAAAFEELKINSIKNKLNKAESAALKRPLLDSIDTFNKKFKNIVEKNNVFNCLRDLYTRYNVPCEVLKVNTDSLNLDETQKSIIHKVSQSYVSVLDGGPGRGKSYTVSGLVSLFQSIGCRVKATAISSRACLVLKDYGVEDSNNFCRFNHTSVNQEYVSARLPFVDDIDLLIVDESSMVDSEQLAILLDRVGYGTRFLFVGDSAQLPPIKYENYSALDIAAQIVNPVTLLKNYRSNPALAKLVDNVRTGDLSDIWSMVRPFDPAELAGRSDTMVLVPTRDCRKRSSNAVAGDADSFSSNYELFHDGDKIMFTRNSRLDNFLNGETAIITGHDEWVIYWIKNNGETGICYRHANIFQRANVMTVHKAQGSEAGKVMVVLDSTKGLHLQTLSWLYVSISRAKQSLEIRYIGDLDKIKEHYKSPEAQWKIPDFSWTDPDNGRGYNEWSVDLDRSFSLPELPDNLIPAAGMLSMTDDESAAFEAYNDLYCHPEYPIDRLFETHCYVNSESSKARRAAFLHKFGISESDLVSDEGIDWDAPAPVVEKTVIEIVKPVVSDGEQVLISEIA